MRRRSDISEGTYDFLDTKAPLTLHSPIRQTVEFRKATLPSLECVVERFLFE
jgi:hypothetical protein